MRDAILWLMSKTKEVGGQPLVYAPGQSNVRDHELLSRFAKTSGVSVATWRGTSSWSGGPVLAAWPNREKLGEIADDRRTRARALCVVPWAAGELDAWIAAAQPELLGPALVPAAGPGQDLDSVVVEGLKSLTASVNHSNNLAGALDKRDAISVLRILHRAGYPLPRDAVYAWALAHGWPTRGAERLRELAGKFEDGVRVQLRGHSPWRDDILEQWRAKAKSREV